MLLEKSDWLQQCTLAVQAAALDDSLWIPALGTVRKSFDASAIALETWDHRHQSSWSFISDGLDAGGLVQIKQLYPESNPRLEDNRDITQGDVTYDYKHRSEAELERCGYVRDMEACTGTRYYLAGVPIRTDLSFAGLTLFHDRRQGHFSEKQAAALKLFLPILQMAIKSSLIMGSHRLLAGLGMAIPAGTGVVLLDAGCNAIFMNDVAQRQFGGPGPRLITVANVRKVMSAAVAGAGGACTWECGSTGRSCEVIGIPVSVDSEAFAPLRPKAALIVHDSMERCRLSVSAVRDLFDLTPREIEVSESVLAGVDIHRVSRRLQIAESTVRVHLRTIMMKTDTHSQVALAAKLRPFMLGQREDGPVAT